MRTTTIRFARASKVLGTAAAAALTLALTGACDDGGPLPDVQQEQEDGGGQQDGDEDGGGQQDGDEEEGGGDEGGQGGQDEED